MAWALLPLDSSLVTKLGTEELSDFTEAVWVIRGPAIHTHQDQESQLPTPAWMLLCRAHKAPWRTGVWGHERPSLALTGSWQCGCHLEPVESKPPKEADRPLARRFLLGLRVSEFKALPSEGVSKRLARPWALGAAASSGAFEPLCHHSPLSWPVAGSRPEKGKGRGRLCAGLCVWFSLAGASLGLSFVFPHFNEKGDG